MLLTIDNVLTQAEVQQFRALLDRADWQDGMQTAGSLARGVKQNLQLNDASELAQNLGRQILNCVSQTPLFISAALPNKIYPPKFNRYEVGGTYGLHVDSAVMRLPDSGLSMRSDVSATLFLSEPEEYEGGELEIEDTFGTQSIKLDAGSMVLYPSTSLHRVSPVTQGARVASFFWIESLVADDGKRTLLFDLDQSIQGLTPVLPANHAHLLSLTGVYHNLLRRWATT